MQDGFSSTKVSCGDFKMPISQCGVEQLNLYPLAVDECPKFSVTKQRGFCIGSPGVKLVK